MLAQVGHELPLFSQDQNCLLSYFLHERCGIEMDANRRRIIPIVEGEVPFSALGKRIVCHLDIEPLRKFEPIRARQGDAAPPLSPLWLKIKNASKPLRHFYTQHFSNKPSRYPGLCGDFGQIDGITVLKLSHLTHEPRLWLSDKLISRLKLMPTA
jgi:hypothetical protein